MDYRIKVVNVPSVLDAVRKGQRVRVNGVMFGYSDRFGAVVSEPVDMKAVEAFRRVPGYAVIDAQTGDLISPPVADVEPNPTEETGLEPSGAEKDWLEAFRERYRTLSHSGKARLPKEELRKALEALKVVAPEDAAKEDLIRLLDEAL
ncbi:hypothetical protein CSW25_07030 [Thermus scotoductus]|uniref:Uncharacterized protein n=1 Tax=Thermus scotoductus TaxID=37636 RepID=A0A430R9J3_THESC|nr:MULTISPECIES: hypothetical protein [Thermus]AYJ74839.1 hypothetical protein phiMa_56 [Thermus phage phiMa]QWK23116.1 MAG: hypothetical protein KNN15_06725 [Thermus antranikianii]RTG93485.1 hypothetical protein CSW49_10680 [Thermus scotoductus]RTH04055.1 hypothetical protein CSW45_05925 [Thermus scotoductus]RTH10919.1 hypothetical protein CSW46_05805 [Thermus scotoductus]